MINIKVLSQKLINTKTDLIILTFFKDIIPLKGYTGDVDWLLNAHLSELIKKEKMLGTYKEVVLINSQNKVPAEKILVMGLGKSNAINLAKIFSAYSALAKIIINIKISDFSFGIFVREIPNIHYQNVAGNILSGLLQEFALANKDTEYNINIIEEDKTKIDLLKKTVKITLDKIQKLHAN